MVESIKIILLVSKVKAKASQHVLMMKVNKLITIVGVISSNNFLGKHM